MTAYVANALPIAKVLQKPNDRTVGVTVRTKGVCRTASTPVPPPLGPHAYNRTRRMRDTHITEFLGVALEMHDGKQTTIEMSTVSLDVSHHGV